MIRCVVDIWRVLPAPVRRFITQHNEPVGFTIDQLCNYVELVEPSLPRVAQDIALAIETVGLTKTVSGLGQDNGARFGICCWGTQK